MRCIGVTIMSLFAAIWWGMGINMSGHASPLVIGAGCLMSLAMAGAAFRAARGLASPAHRDGRRIARVVMWASAGEGIAIVAAVNALNWVGLPDYAICALAVIVGLHFVPLARGIPNARFYNITAVALVALGVAGCVIPPAQRGLVVGTVAAMILWATCLGVIATLRTERRPLAYAA